MKTSSKRKRTKAELEEVKQEEEALRNDTQGQDVLESELSGNVIDEALLVTCAYWKCGAH